MPLVEAGRRACFLLVLFADRGRVKGRQPPVGGPRFSSDLLFPFWKCIEGTAGAILFYLKGLFKLRDTLKQKRFTKSHQTTLTRFRIGSCIFVDRIAAEKQAT